MFFLRVEAAHPRSAVSGARAKRTNTLCKEDVIRMVIAAQIEHLRGNDMGGQAQEGKHRPGIGDTSPIRQREAPDSDTHIPGRGWAVRPPWTMNGRLEIEAFPLSLSHPVVPLNTSTAP
eukprot:15167-Pyramimonas_sp.AAC.1